MKGRERSVLLIASDPIGSKMAGVGIRYWNLARVLGQQMPVTLATPGPVDLAPPSGVTLQSLSTDTSDPDENGRKLADIIADHQIIVTQHIPYYSLDAEILSSRRFVVDLYAPAILEKLEHARIDPVQGEPARKDDVATLNRQLLLGDFFICASERQRDFWLGALATAGRLELTHAQADPELRSLIDVVPFGMPEESPVSNGPGPRGRFSQVGPNDPVLLWNGGMWNWLDPLTAIEAIARLVPEIPDVRLVFMGVRSSAAGIPEMEIVEKARRLAGNLNLLDRHVFFNDWVLYEERQNWLLEANAALSLHLPTAEARYAFRTRMLDLFWCMLPVVATEGDTLAEMVREHGIGAIAPPGDPDAVAEAIRLVLEPNRNRAMRERIEQVAAAHTWERASQPLIGYCKASTVIPMQRGLDPTADYIHQLERTYDDTAAYARRLEGEIAEQKAAMESGICHRLRRTLDRVLSWIRGR